MEIQATNGKAYQVRFANDGSFEIERDDEATGLRKVFVFKDFGISAPGRKEVVFYSYDITPTGERTYTGRHNFKDSDIEFAALLNSEWWDTLRQSIINGFIKKIEHTEAITENPQP